MNPEGDDGDFSLSPVDWGLEDLVAALLQQQPIGIPGSDPFVLRDDNARRILGHYTDNRQLWLRAKPVRKEEIEGVLRALGDPLPSAVPIERKQFDLPSLSLAEVDKRRNGFRR